METCKICNQQLKALTWKHLRFKHNISIQEYDEKFGYQIHGIAPKLSQEQIEKINKKKKVNLLGIKV